MILVFFFLPPFFFSVLRFRRKRDTLFSFFGYVKFLTVSIPVHGTFEAIQDASRWFIVYRIRATHKKRSISMFWRSFETEISIKALHFYRSKEKRNCGFGLDLLRGGINHFHLKVLLPRYWPIDPFRLLLILGWINHTLSVYFFPQMLHRSTQLTPRRFTILPIQKRYLLSKWRFVRFWLNLLSLIPLPVSRKHQISRNWTAITPVAGEISSFRIYKAHRIKLIEAWNCFQFDCATGGTSNYRHRIAMCRLVEFTARKVALPFICNLFPLWYRAVTKLDSLYGIFFFFFFPSSMQKCFEKYPYQPIERSPLAC